MGGIGGMLGLSGGAAGTGFAAPKMADISNPVNQAQIQASYEGTQGALSGQQALVSALQSQNGIANQSAVFDQYGNIVAGKGPNPAQAQLAQATGANTANQAALMAGQRGAGQNVGLIARQAGQQGAANQQQAVGQAATMQAQQQLAALGQQANISGQQVGNQIGAVNANTQAQLAEQQNLLGAQAAFNQAQVGAQNGVNVANAGLAGQQLGNQAGVIGGVLNAGGAAAGRAGAAGGMVQSYAEGADVQAPNKYTLGMNTQMPGNPMQQAAAPQPQVPQKSAGPSSGFGQFLKNMGSNMPATDNNQPQSGQASLQKGMSSALTGLMSRAKSPDQSQDTSSQIPSASSMQMPKLGQSSGFAKGGEVPALVSPGEIYLSPRAVEMVKKGAHPKEVGEVIPGKPRVGGAQNSYANDTVPKKLQVGGIVEPRSVTQSKNSDEDCARFVQAVLAKRKMGK
ncbi:MAG: hypothetical protein V4440_12980 [Pseudomonadota bacterium]